MTRAHTSSGLAQRGHHDYSALGRELLASLGLDDANASKRANMNAVWKGDNGATIFVGNDTAARGPASAFKASGITHVVNCTDDLPNYCSAGAGAPSYLRFNIAAWKSAGHSDFRTSPHADVIAHLERMLAWVDAALAGGGNVLVHCLAGAHRAGTTGIVCVMHKTGMGAREATAIAQRARPIIEPIYDFAECLQVFEAAQRDGARTASTAGPR